MDHKRARVGLVAATTVIVALAATATPANASQPTLPKGTTYWKVVDYKGVDCADCEGFRVLRRLTSRRARVAYLSKYPDGSRAVMCVSLHRTGGGRWLDSYDELWTYHPGNKSGSKPRLRVEELKGDWWVSAGKAKEAAVESFLTSASLQAEYNKCVG